MELFDVDCDKRQVASQTKTEKNLKMKLFLMTVPAIRNLAIKLFKTNKTERR